MARVLERAGVGGVSVATFDEAVELREAGVATPVHVLYQVPVALLREAADRRVAVTAGEPAYLEAMLAEVGRWAPARAEPLRVQLEVETGLGRDGIPVDAVVPAARAIGATRGVALHGTWSHLTAPADRARTGRQVDRFEDALARLRAEGIDPGLRHLAASGGLFGDMPCYDLVRPGISTYGLVPDGTEAAASSTLAATLAPVLALRARPVRVADLPAGWGISYGPSFVTGRPSRIATLPLGYGDGWARASSNRADALVRGGRAPIVGTVSMDAVMVDVTDVPGPPVTTADEFTLIGSDGAARIGAEEVARSRTTISYEVVTAMSRRLARVYHSAAGPIGLRALTTGD